MHSLLSSLHLGTEASPSACSGRPEPPAEGTVPPALGAGAAGLAPEAAGRCWAWPCSQGPGWSRPAPAVQGRRRTRQRQVKCSGVPALLLLPSLLFQPGPIAGSLTACAAFSQSPGARGKVGTGSARLVIVRSAFWLSKLQIRERLHGVSDNMF